MARLRYRWGDETQHRLWQHTLEGRGGGEERPLYEEIPVPRTAALVVGDRVVWSGDITGELQAWIRHCALASAEEWGCPPRVRQFLETGAEDLRASALATAELHANEAIEAVSAAWDAVDAATFGPDLPEAWPRVRVERWVPRLSWLHAALLRRALPERHRGLIDSPEPGAQEVLCDVLLSLG